MNDQAASEQHTRTVDLPPPNNAFYHLAGAAILALNKIRHAIQGYRTPRTFSIEKTGQAIDYDYSVVENWLDALAGYGGSTSDIEGASILELGPGADLGIGLILLSMGARKYNALDVNDLENSVPTEFYNELFDTMRSKGIPQDTIKALKEQLGKTMEGKNDALNYVVRKDFDIRIFSKEKINLVFSQAAFEHFDDIPLTFQRLFDTVEPGTRLIAEVDLATHTRWIRDRDPLNIYRYGNTFYNACRFLGSPNRLTPSEYRKALAESGWRDIVVWPLSVADPQYSKRVIPRLSKRFRQRGDEMAYLSIMICATKP